MHRNTVKMKIPWVCLSSLVLTTAIPAPFSDFESVRLLSRLDQPREAQNPLQESPFHKQYDGRFANQGLDIVEKYNNTAALVQSYLISMNDLGIQTWLMHNTLMDWYLSRKLRSGRSQIDVLVSQKSIEFLADFCNMTVYRHKPEGFWNSRDYLLEVNPGWNENRGIEADARFIDTYTGLYIDLKTFRESDGEDEGGYQNRDYALQETVFEGVPARVPVPYAAMLVEEFGPDAISPLPND